MSDKDEVLAVYPHARISEAQIHNYGRAYIVVSNFGLEFGTRYWPTVNEAWADARSKLPNAPAPPLAPEPVEQGEPACAVCGATDCVIDHAQFTPAPSQPEFPQDLCLACKQPLVFPAYDDPAMIGKTSVVSSCRHTLQVRDEGAALREIQQLREQVDELTVAIATACELHGCDSEECTPAQYRKDAKSLIDENYKLQQQLAQIKEYKGERPLYLSASTWRPDAAVCVKSEVDPLLDQRDQTIAALRLDNAQKDARIRELEGGKS